jgi:site-specific recombinase XerD
MTWTNDFQTYLTVSKNLATKTATSYLYDAKLYAEFASVTTPYEISGITFSRKSLRDFAAHLRMKELAESTIERQVHGVLAFWNYCHEEAGHPTKPIRFHDLGLLIKSSKNPTSPLEKSEYSHFMKSLKNEIDNI